MSANIPLNPLRQPAHASTTSNNSKTTSKTNTTTPFSILWTQAYTNYQTTTGHSLLTTIPTTLTTTSDLLTLLTTQNSTFTTFRATRPRLFTLLKTTLQPLEVLSRLAGAAVQATPIGPTAAIFVGTSYLIASANGVSEAYGAIVGLLERLSEWGERVGEYVGVLEGEMDGDGGGGGGGDGEGGGLRKRVVLILGGVLEVLALAELRVREGRWREWGRVVWGGKDGGVMDAVERLEGLIGAEGRFVAAKTLGVVVGVKGEVERLGVGVGETRKELLKDATNKSIRMALYTDAIPKVAETQARILSERQDGSGEWLQSEKLYKAWLKGDLPTLFILGGPGSGKSYLVCSAIAHLFKSNASQKGTQRAITGYFYIREDDSQLRSLNTILKTIAFQLQEKSPIYASYVARVTSNPQKALTAADTWKSLFLDFFNGSKSDYGENVAYIVLDGVDEAPRKERETLFKLLRDLDESKEKRIRILVVGRPDLRDDTAFFWDRPILYIEVSARKTRDDIVGYIKSSIGRVRALNQSKEPLEKRKQLRKDIIQKLSDGANGMFLWVNLMFDSIKDLSRASSVLEALNTAPRSLSKMIHNAFQRMAAENLRGFKIDDFNEILNWVTFAQRPLSLRELDTILRLQPPLGEGVPEIEKRLRDQFASFFVLKRKDRLTTEALLERAAEELAHPKSVDEDTEESDDSDSDSDESEDSDDGLPLDTVDDPYNSPFHSTKITFSHLSVRDYLIRESNPAKRDFPADLGIGVNRTEAQKAITMICLKVLAEDLKLPYREESDSDSDSGSGEDEDDDDDESDSDESTDKDSKTKSEDDTNQTLEYIEALEQYASDYFYEHLSRTDRLNLTLEDQAQITRYLMQLFSFGTAMDHWIDGMSSMETLVKDWINPGKKSEWIRGWFVSQLQLQNKTYTTTEKETLQRLSISGQALFKDFATECATRWLTHDRDEYLECFAEFLDQLLPQSDSSTSTMVSSPQTSAYNKSNTYLTEARLNFIANSFPELTKDSYWYSNLGESLRIECHYEAAVKALHTAISLSSKNLIAIARISTAYDDLGFWREAIFWAYKALEAFPERGYGSERSDMWDCISLCSLELMEYEEAKKAAGEALKLNPRRGYSLASYMLCMDAAMQDKELLKYAHTLQATPSSSQNLLNAALLVNENLHTSLSHAARRLDALAREQKKQQQPSSLNFVVSAIQSAASTALADEDGQEYANQHFLLGEIYYMQSKGPGGLDPKKAIECWELVLESKEATPSIQESAADYLAEVYYRSAIILASSASSSSLSATAFSLATSKEIESAQKPSSSSKDGGSRNKYISKLERLARYNPANGTTIKSGAGQLLGLWWREHGEEEKGKRAVYASVMDAIRTIENAELEGGLAAKQTDGWEMLAAALLKGGDVAGARVAYAVEMKRMIGEEEKKKKRGLTSEVGAAGKLVDGMAGLELGVGTQLTLPKEVPKEEDKVEKEAEIQPLAWPGNTTWFCDGYCRRPPTSWRVLHVCTVCLYSNCFCEICIDLVKEDRLPFRVCASDHKWIEILPVQEGMGRGENGMLGLGMDTEGRKREIGLAEWLAGLRRE